MRSSWYMIYQIVWPLLLLLHYVYCKEKQYKYVRKFMSYQSSTQTWGQTNCWFRFYWVWGPWSCSMWKTECDVWFGFHNKNNIFFSDVLMQVSETSPVVDLLRRKFEQPFMSSFQKLRFAWSRKMNSSNIVVLLYWCVNKEACKQKPCVLQKVISKIPGSDFYSSFLHSWKTKNRVLILKAHNVTTNTVLVFTVGSALVRGPWQM
jgi:hypothetical protein